MTQGMTPRPFWPGTPNASGGGSYAAGRFEPVVPVDVQITSQTGQFVNPGTFVGVGLYTIDLIPMPGVTSADQVIPLLTGSSTGPVFGAAQVTFAAGHATITVSVFDNTGSPVSDSFCMHVDFIL